MSQFIINLIFIDDDRIAVQANNNLIIYNYEKNIKVGNLNIDNVQVFDYNNVMGYIVAIIKNDDGLNTIAKIKVNLNGFMFYIKIKRYFVKY